MKFFDRHEAGKASLLISLLLLVLLSQAQGQRALRLERSLAGQEREIDSFSLSPDGRSVATVSNRRKYDNPGKRLVNIFKSTDKLFAVESTLKLWDLRTGELKWTITEPGVYSVEVMFSSSGKLFATHDWSSDGSVKIWEAATGRLKAKLTGEGKGIYEVVFSPDERTIATSYRESSVVKLWDVETGQLRARITAHMKPVDYSADFFYAAELIFSPDGRRLATPDEDKVVRLWDVATGTRVMKFQGSDSPPIALSHVPGPSNIFSPDGKIAVTSEAVQVDYSQRQRTYQINIWDAESGKLLRSLDGAYAPARFSPDGKILATSWVAKKGEKSSAGIIKLWNVSTGELLKTLGERDEGVDQIEWSPDRRTLAAAGGETYTLWLWDVETGRLKTVQRLVRHHGWDYVSDYISDLDLLFFSPDSRALLLANQKSMRVLDARTGALLQSFDKTGLPALFTPESRLLTIGVDKKSIAVWEIPAK